MTDFTPSAIMAAGYKRIKSIQDRHGINSPEVLSACERWGGILDDVNYPDSSCRWCGEAVTHTWEGPLIEGPDNYYIHTDTQKRPCWESAPAVATPTDWKKVKESITPARPMTDVEIMQAKTRISPINKNVRKLTN